MSKSKKSLLIGGSFLLPFLLLIILWSILGLAPFGNNNLLVSDLGTQYMPFLSAFKQFFQGETYSLYSFSDALGGTILPLSAYYLLSPFNILALLFSYEQLPLAILLIITLKISFMGSSMFYYLQKTYQQSTFATLLFSTSYSLCGFVTVYCLNFMWLDALILLPLLVLGIQRLWDHKKYVLYSVSLFLAIVTNYYMGYMLCIFAVCYSFFWYYQKTETSEKKSVWHFIKEGRLFFVTSFLTGISTSFILIPAIEGMLATKKTSFDWHTFLPTPNFGFNFLSQLGLGSVNFEWRLEHLPTIFSGLLMVLLFIAYFQLSTISKKEKLGVAFLVGFIFLSFWLELVNTIWHMFQSPAGFPYRNTFIFSFLMIKFAYEAFLKLKQGATLSIVVPSVFSALLIIGYVALKFSKEKIFLLSDHYFLISLFGIWLIYSLIILSQKTRGLQQIGIYTVLFLIVCSELVFNFWISFKDIPFGNQEKFAHTYQIQDTIISDLQNKQGDLFRIKQTIDSDDAGYREKNNGYNNPILYGYAGVSSYTSTLDAKTQDTLHALGLYQKNDRRIAYVDESQVINLLLNVNYQLTPELKLHQENLSNDPSTNVYENNEAIGMGFLVPQEFGELKLAKNQPLKNQEMILQQIQERKQTYFQDTQNVAWTAQADNNYTLTTKTTANGELYLYAPEIDWKKVTSFKVNGEKIQPAVYIVTNQLFNLGYFKKDEVVQIEFESEKEVGEQKIELKTLQQEVFDSFITKQKTQAIQLDQAVSGTLKGEVTVTDSENSLLYLAVPYDKNWRITVDGKKVKATSVLGNFTGIELTSGKHHITMHYQQRNFIVGFLISISVLLGVLFYQLLKRFKIRKSK
ncbi:YfhO family protein [Candidatus Enterococcus ikei]|uniref:YfhO family protein n=1 Tax=Candidatus Enterococcus ikei TaxID=2815326 RepID=A0ABS3GXI9_9ENTE|nr:YfhO family protein [Enterococcus sp. DIV0869a]MBO0439980.1 YfhO family protein [Enterococcus sp. DIV0869a]